MLAVIVQGAVSWYSEGLGANPMVQRATERWRAVEDTVGSFIAEALTVSRRASVAGSALYEAYVSFCEDQGATPRRNASFVKELLGHAAIPDGAIEKRNSGGRAVYRGIGLISEESPGASCGTPDAC